MSDKRKIKEELAVALFYDGRNAPRVTAKGSDKVAREIKRVAEENDVPLYEDVILAQVLSQIDLGEEIPRALYIAIAEVIAFTYLISGKVCPIPQQAAATELPLLPEKPLK
ncbi:MAG TPA: flagellar protein FhlB [Gammaproteobacteria bacterium]|nr:flagellar protein FhlB [Gammaproteobacteria bacterium]